MNELQLSLIAAGVVVLLGVVAYNAWQGSKARARIPRRMPADGAGRAMRNKRPPPARWRAWTPNSPRTIPLTPHRRGQPRR